MLQTFITCWVVIYGILVVKLRNMRDGYEKVFYCQNVFLISNLALAEKLLVVVKHKKVLSVLRKNQNSKKHTQFAFNNELN